MPKSEFVPMPPAAAPDIEFARKFYELYRLRGKNPFPSRTDTKRPCHPYREYWDTLAPADIFDRYPTSNLQVVTGRRWGLLVIDLDGPEAIERFKSMGDCPPTWTVISGSGGKHLWFAIPRIGAEIPKAILWRGEGTHSAIERLGDHSLAVAPPSIHPKTGKRYVFADRERSPVGMPMPAPCPRWVLEVPPISEPIPEPLAVPRVERRIVPKSAGHYLAAEVLAAIPDKVGLVRSWGLRLTGRGAGRGALECRAIDREDQEPSAIFNPESGRYWDPWVGKAIGIFELGARLGVYGDWRDAVRDLGARFVGRRVA